MYQVQKDNMLYMTKWWYAFLTNSLLTALSYGYKTIRCLRDKLRIMNAYLKIIECYKVFDTKPHWVYKIVFSDVASTNIVMNVEVDVGGATVSVIDYTGTADGTAIATYFTHQFNYHGGGDWGSFPVYAEHVDNTLYLYNYNGAGYTFTFADTTTVGGVPYAYPTTETNLTQDPAEVLTAWNNLTQEQICDIYNHFKYLYESKTGTGNSQCCS